jgi:hypothetical protein
MPDSTPTPAVSCAQEQMATKETRTANQTARSNRIYRRLKLSSMVISTGTG